MKSGYLFPCILYGPPGSGKTSFAKVLEKLLSWNFLYFRGSSGQISELKKTLNQWSKQRRGTTPLVLFVDEIHRLNKSQQDFFLPLVESGAVVLIGATTENPGFEINPALLSRCKVLVFKALSEDDLVIIQKRALEKDEYLISLGVETREDLLHQIAQDPEGRYGALVYDAHDEYYKTVQSGLVGLNELNMDNIHYYDLHEETSPKITLTSISASDIISVFPELSSAQIDACILMNDLLGNEWLIELINLEYDKIKYFCDETLQGLVKDITVKALLRKIRILASKPYFVEHAGLDLITEVKQKLDRGEICIINTRNLTDLEERAVLTIVTSKILGERKRLLDENPEMLLQKPVTLIVLEEALSVLSEKVLRRGTNIFVDLVREGRKYKIGLLCVVQIPHRLDPDVAGNINTNVILGLAQNRGRRAVADNAMDDMDPLIDEMKMLDVGEAIISFPHKGEVPFPLPVKIHHFNDLVEQHRDAQDSESEPQLHEAFME